MQSCNNLFSLHATIQSSQKSLKFFLSASKLLCTINKISLGMRNRKIIHCHYIEWNINEGSKVWYFKNVCLNLIFICVRKTRQKVEGIFLKWAAQNSRNGNAQSLEKMDENKNDKSFRSQTVSKMHQFIFYVGNFFLFCVKVP
jgi:hypothetical protein